nr:secretion protein HlyD [Selenomonas flueggei]
MFCPIKAANRTQGRGYVEDLLTISGRKRCVKMVVPNLSVLPYIQTA